MEENIYKSYPDESPISRIYKEHLHLNNKDKKPNLKMGKGFEYTFLQRRYTHYQKAHEKMLNIISH